MTPFHFGDDNRCLFGILTPRPAGKPPRRGVVLCNAFGREAIRAHRVLRVLADRLSRAGCDVLRFDYYGTGDSAGDDDAIDLDGFGADLLAAHQELLRRTGVSQVGWLGMRLGAVVAQRTALAQAAPLADLTLWDPIFDGRDYLDLLRRRHLEWSSAGDDPVGHVPPVFRDNPKAYLDEAIGFPLPRTMCDQLRTFRLTDSIRRDATTHIVFDPGTDEGKQIESLASLAGQTTRVPAAHGTDWTTEGDATALVPPAVMALLVDRAKGAA